MPRRAMCAGESASAHAPDRRAERKVMSQGGVDLYGRSCARFRAAGFLPLVVTRVHSSRCESLVVTRVVGGRLLERGPEVWIGSALGS